MNVFLPIRPIDKFSGEKKMNDILRAPFETECLQLYRHQRKHIAANLFYHFNPCSRLLLAIQADTPNVPNGQHGKSLFKSLMAFGEFQ